MQNVTLLQRWVTTFVGAGTAAVVNRVDDQVALADRAGTPTGISPG